MSYKAGLRKKAWGDTWDLVLESPLVTILIAIAIFGFTVLFTYLWKEEKDVTDLLIDAGIGCLSTAIVFVAVFLFHLLYLTPKHLYLEQKSAKEKAEQEVSKLSSQIEAPPPIAGKWVRGINGVLTLSLNGMKVTGDFKEGEIDHTIDGDFDPVVRRFIVTTTRIHTRGIEPRNIQKDIYWVPDNDTLLYHCDRNFSGRPETGIFRRMGSTDAVRI